MKQRGLLIANPNATSTSPGLRDVITRALGHEIDLDVITTTHRGHAQDLAGAAQELDVLITLGGDGTINEAVNGLLNSGRGRLPMLATIPGGSANVLARALGFPNDALEATGMILESLRTDASHDLGVGNAVFTAVDTGIEHSKWFTINAGIGMDADVIAAMEVQRRAGRPVSGTRYAWTAFRQYLKDVARRDDSPISLHVPGQEPVSGLTLVIVQNTAPWTFFGPFPINPCPRASYDLGLDVFALHSLSVLSTTRYGLRMLRGSRAGAVEGHLTLLHDETNFSLHCQTALNLQLDGDSMGRIEQVTFWHNPHALRIVG